MVRTQPVPSRVVIVSHSVKAERVAHLGSLSETEPRGPTQVPPLPPPGSPNDEHRALISTTVAEHSGSIIMLQLYSQLVVPAAYSVNHIESLELFARG